MGDAQMAEGKYQPAMLLQMFRKAAKLRKEMRDAGFTDMAVPSTAPNAS
jgi:hypothetical protein